MYIKALSLLLIIPFFSFSNDIKKHDNSNYGEKLTKGRLGVHPLTESLENIPPDNVSVNPGDNVNLQNQHQFFLQLSTHEKDNNIIASVTFSNKSGNAFLIHKGLLPINTQPTLMCGKTLIITTENIALNYQGQYCRFSTEIDKNDWALIPAGTSLSYTVNLNNLYSLPPGKHNYSIVTYSYEVVNHQWFLEQETHKHIFNIINFKYICTRRSGSDYVSGERWLCLFDSEENIIENFFSRFHFNNQTENLFIINSNRTKFTWRR